MPVSARGRVLDGYVHLADWFATLKVLAGSTEDVPEGSLSIASYIAGAVDKSPREGVVPLLQVAAAALSTLSKP